MVRALLTIAVFTALTLRPATVHAASDPHAKKPAAADAPAAKPAAPVANVAKSTAPDPHATKSTAPDPHATKPAGADAHAAKPAAPDAHATKKVAADAHSTKKTAGADAHAEKKSAAADPHAPSRGGAHAAAHADAGHASAASPSKPATEKTAPAARDLHALNERIQERVAEVRKAQSAKASAGPKAPAQQVRVHASAAQPRVTLVWRVSLDWPQELDDDSAATQSHDERVSLSWAPMAP
jgi:long-chain acyl-CoA synthetase